jgi:hypothetical protein
VRLPVDPALDERGTRIGYAPETARKSAWQFIRKADGPRVSVPRRFARAWGIPLEELVAEKKGWGEVGDGC